MIRSLFAILMCGIVGLTGGCSIESGGSAATNGDGTTSVKVAFVPNNTAEFWQTAKAGVQAAEKEFNVTCDFRMPDDGTPAKQQQIVQDLLAAGVEGIAISPIDPANMTDLLNEAGSAVPTICMDSDAPDTNRRCFVGTNNFEAGKAVGKLVKEAIPDGGKVMIFVGRVDAPSGGRRVDGVKAELEGSNCEVVDVRTDMVDAARAKQNAEDAIAAHPDLKCMVGIWAYNPPAILSALRGANKVGEVAIIGFDEDKDTLQAIIDGEIHGTVVQDPYQFGYQSVKILAALARGEDAGIPEDKINHIAERVIKKGNVEEFWAELKRLQSDEAAAEPATAE